MPQNTLKKDNDNLIMMPIVIGVAVALGMWIGANFFGKNNYNSNTKNYSKIKEVLQLIQDEYVDSVDVATLTDDMIATTLERLDPHTSYIPASDVEVADAQLETNFEGIGIEFYISKDTLVVANTVQGGPSEAAGLRAGDRIIAVDGAIIAGVGISNKDVFSKLRGEKGSKVNLSVLRHGEKLDFIITRDKIPSHSVEAAYLIKDKTAYIKISRFTAGTHDEFKESLLQLKKEGASQLVLDLRDNSGGYMNSSIKIADELIAGDRLIVYTEGKGKKNDEKYTAGRKGIFEEQPIIVLLNEGSASASEILAGALQDNDRALIVGRRSYGKGLVQYPFNLSDGAELRLTISRYYTPTGRCIQKPYSAKDIDGYELDVENRYKNGELFIADSMKIDRSLTYKTPAGRIVYGGGGIIPDYFIPLDTSQYSSLLGKLYSTEIIREFAYNYVEKNAEKLKKEGFTSYIKNFQINDSCMTQLLQIAEKNQIPTQNLTAKEHKKIKDLLKSFIARSVWGENAFYQVINQQDEMINTALTLFPKVDTWLAGEK